MYTAGMTLNELTAVVAVSHARIGSPRRVLVACSGGADSVALLLALLPLRNDNTLEIQCVHVNHGLRAEAGEDETFVEALCARYNFTLTCVHVQVEASGSVEEKARIARYQALRSVAARWPADVIALGHHMDDQAETVLLRLLHGAGSRGLSAMREFSHGLWRPLLGVRRHELITALEGAGQDWCTDSSNADIMFMRNRIRLELLPLLSGMRESAIENIARSADVFSSEDDYWRAMAEAWLSANASRHPACPYLSWYALADLHIALQRQVLLRLAELLDLALSYSHVERLRALGVGEYLNLPGNWRGYRSAAFLFLLPSTSHRLPLGAVVESVNEETRHSKSETFDMDKMQGAVVRYRQPGDRITPLGFAGTRKLSDYFIDRKVDWPFRDHWPIVCKDEAVLWVPGIGMAQDAAVTEDTHHTGVLRYDGLLPDEYIGFGGHSP